MLTPWADNFIPVIPSADAPVHTPERPFCSDQSCPCHELDLDSIARVHQWYLDGIITAEEATDIIMGRRAW